MSGHVGRFWLALLLAGLLLGGLTACQMTPTAPRPGAINSCMKMHLCRVRRAAGL